MAGPREGPRKSNATGEAEGSRENAPLEGGARLRGWHSVQDDPPIRITTLIEITRGSEAGRVQSLMQSG